MNIPRNTAEVKKIYEAIAEDFSVSRARHWHDFNLLLKAIPQGAKLLDLGCGNGRFLHFLNDEGRSVLYTGVDFSPRLLAIARKQFPKEEFIEADMTELRLERTFQRIVCIAAFHHIPTRKLRKKALQRIAEHLDDDGLLLLSVWNLWQWKYAPALMKGFLRTLLSGFREDPRDLLIPFGQRKIPRYYHAFLPMELRRFLRDNGFSIESETVTRGNIIFSCRKNVLVPVPTPVFVAQPTT